MTRPSKNLPLLRPLAATGSFARERGYFAGGVGEAVGCGVGVAAGAGDDPAAGAGAGVGDGWGGWAAGLIQQA